MDALCFIMKSIKCSGPPMSGHFNTHGVVTFFITLSQHWKLEIPNLLKKQSCETSDDCNVILLRCAITENWSESVSYTKSHLTMSAHAHFDLQFSICNWTVLKICNTLSLNFNVFPFCNFSSAHLGYGNLPVTS